MNAALGTAGVALGLAAAVIGAITIVVGLVGNRPALLRSSRLYVGLLIAGALCTFFAMERALITRDFSLEYVARNGSHETPPLYNFAALWSALEGSIILWSLILTGYIAVVVHHFRKRLTDPLVGWAIAVMFVVAAFFFLLMLGPANPFKTVQGAIPTRRPRPEPVAAEPHPHGVPPADALPRLRRVHGAVRVRDRRADHRAGRRGLAHRDAPVDALRVGLPRRSASCSARGGATRCSAGAATGRGTRSRTRRSFRGSPAPRTCTR